MRIKEKTSSQIDYKKPLKFTFNGQDYQGYQGDTLASALLANQCYYLARGFKYGRKRGLISAGVEEANALISLELAGYYTPNLKATEIYLYAGLNAVSASRLTGLDMRACLKPLHRFMAAGFYYKTFIKQRYWAMVEDKLRQLSGFSKAPSEPDAENYDHHHHHCEALVIGGGIAGMTAALTLLDNSRDLRVILLDERRILGGELLSDIAFDTTAKKHYDTLQTRLLVYQKETRLTILTQTSAFAWHDNNLIHALEKISDDIALDNRDNQSQTRQILHKIRAQEVILATGAHERPMLFSHNDLINVMLAQAVRRYANEFNVVAGKNIIVYGNNDSIYRVALDLYNHGIKVSVIDVRTHSEAAELTALKNANVKILFGHAVVNAVGKAFISAVDVVSCHYENNQWQLTGDKQRLDCDVLATSAGFSPVVHLDCHTGAKPVFDVEKQCFMPAQKRAGRVCCGSVTGLSDWQVIGVDAHNKAAEVLAKFDIDIGLQTSNNTDDLSISDFFTPKALLAQPKIFVDMQNDVTTTDIALSIREGYQSIEHIKRYTAMGFGTDQGKTGNINGIAVAARLLAVPMSDIGTTTFRPAYTAVTFGALAGRMSGALFDPERVTMIHKEHVKLGAEFEVVGQWYRAWYYPQAGEDMHQAVMRESLAARTSLAVMDASTLGKIDIQGSDAREFLARVYTNAWQKLAIGQCRYGIMCDEKGMIIDDGVTACLADNHFMMTTTTGGAASVYSTLEMWLQTEWSDLDVKLTSVTDQWATVAVVGPNARHLMRQLCTDIDFDKANFAFMQWREGTVCGVRARVMRISFSGELSYEINVQANYGSFIWQQVMAFGEKWQITPYGTETMHVLRAEKGYIIVGQDTDGSVTPGDANMNWIVAKNKPFSYIGQRSFALSELNRGDRKQLVGLQTKEANFVIPEGAHIVDSNDKSIGHVTSSYFSPILKRSIALAMVQSGLNRMGEAVCVKLVQAKQTTGSVDCKIVNSVFYDNNGDKVDGND